MKNLLLALGIIISISSCSEDATTFELLDGTYTGTFGRSGPNARYVSSNVEITFDNQKFEGTSDREKYPAICKGTYKIIGSEIEFVDSCFWTSEFDWTFILAGKFELSWNGEEIIITRSYEGGVVDVYRLKRQ